MRIAEIAARGSLFLFLLVLGLFSLAGAAEVQADTAAAPRAVLLLKMSSAEGSEVSFGRSAAEGATSRGIKEPFEKLGIQFVSAGALTPTVGQAEEGLPLSDAVAIDMARHAGAGIAVVVGIVLQPQGVIRATQFLSQRATLRLRVIDVAAGEVAFDTRTTAYGYHKSRDQGGKLAAARAITKAAEGLVPELRMRWPGNSQATGTAFILTVTGADNWRPLAAILQRLAATKGIDAVHALEIRSSRVRLQVSSRQSVTSLLATLRRTRIMNGTISVSASGNAITISLQMSAPIAPVSHG